MGWDSDRRRRKINQHAYGLSNRILCQSVRKFVLAPQATLEQSRSRLMAQIVKMKVLNPRAARINAFLIASVVTPGNTSPLMPQGKKAALTDAGKAGQVRCAHAE